MAMSFRDSLIRLMGNWSKGLHAKQSEIWLSEIERGGWTEADVEKAVERCLRDKSRLKCPEGFSEFARYLPSARITPESTAITGAWWGADGAWGGDWSHVKPDRLTEVAAVMLEHAAPGRDKAEARQQFVQMAVDRGADMEAIEARTRELRQQTQQRWQEWEEHQLRKAAEKRQAVPPKRPKPLARGETQ